MGVAPVAAGAFFLMEVYVSYLDVSSLSDDLTNDVLEYMYKAARSDDGDIWRPVEAMVIRRLVELITTRGLKRLSIIQDQFLKFAKGSLYRKAAPQPTPVGYQAWSDTDIDLVKSYLEGLPPDAWTIDDYMLSIDYLVHRYLPASELAAEGEWMAVRASLMGKVQANLAKEPTAKQADKALQALPSTAADAFHQFTLNDAEKGVMAFGKARAVENVVSLPPKVAHSMKGVVLQHLEDKMYGNPGGKFSSLESALSDRFAALNRDWRRIAITESGECMNQGMIAGMKAGQKAKRIEMYIGACEFCQKINGKIMTVVAADAKFKDPDTMIWPGKNNVGRSASPRKRVGSVLIPRTPEEMWTIPSGLAHPNCRGRWLRIADPKPGDDPDFAAWLEKTLGAK